MARLAVETGVWALKEAVYGEVSTTLVPKKLRPVEEYLACQERFAHLFWPERQEEVLREIQERVDEYWREVGD